MKLACDDKSIASNVGGAKQFGISANSAKLFSMLSTALYTNKRRAVLAEIGANCHDEHIASKVDRPWDLTIPTTLDPYIKFRDYGRGLSEEQVYNLLTTYGESTKSDSNDFIGAYGIGSKSPAAVTSTWNVVSRHKGSLTEYLVFIDRTGIPSITKLRTEKCDDSGLEVIIPVNPNQVYNWTSELVDAYKHYPIKPNVINHKVDWPGVRAVAISGDGWKVHHVENTYSSRAFAICSNREYALDASTLKNEFKNESWIRLLSWDMTVHFPIGELDMSLSRESLQYTQHTLNALRTKFVQIEAHIKSLIETHLAPAKDGVEYRQLVRSASNEILKCNNMRAIMPFIEGNKFNVNNEYDLSEIRLKVKDLQKKNIHVMYGSDGRISQLKPSFTCGKTYAVRMDKDYQSSDGEIGLKISFFDKLNIVINNVRGARARVKSAFKGKLAIIVDENIFPKEFKRFVVKASTLPVPPRQPRVPKAVRASTVSDVWTMWRKSFIKIDVAKLDKAAKYVFVEVDNVKSQQSIPGATINAIKTLAQYDVKTLFIKKGKVAPKFAEPLQKYINDEVARLNSPSFVEEQHYYALASQISCSWDTGIKMVRNCDYRTPFNSKWNEIKDMFEMIKTKSGTAHERNREYAKLMELADIAGVKLASHEGEVPTIDSITAALYNQYKMLKYASNSINKDDLVEYLNQVGA